MKPRSFWSIGFCCDWNCVCVSGKFH